MPREVLAVHYGSRVAPRRESFLNYHVYNEPDGQIFTRSRCTAAYMSRAMAFYRFRHVERAMGMIFKAVGLPPRGRLSDLSAKASWRLIQWRRQRFAARLAA